MSKTPTPRTDTVRWRGSFSRPHFNAEETQVVSADFARELEQELAAALSALRDAEGKVAETWRPISTAPMDGTPFIWFRYITILTKPVTYNPQVEIVRRHWLREKTGRGYWMGQYTSHGGGDLSYGWWTPLQPEPDLANPHEAGQQPKESHG